MHGTVAHAAVAPSVALRALKPDIYRLSKLLHTS
jgi:hypothetical protein